DNCAAYGIVRCSIHSDLSFAILPSLLRGASMQRDTVRIYDTTLRDGLRNSGIVMTIEQKLAFVRQLEALNVDAIEIGYGGPSQIETMKQLSQAVTGPVVYGLSRVNIKDVDRVLESVERAKKPG